MSAGPPRHPHGEAWLAEARHAGALATGVVYPCSRDALAGALEARDAGLIDPLLIGPEATLRELADRASLSLADCRFIDVAEPVAAAREAAALARDGAVAALMKGSLHTDELMGVVVSRDGGLRTARRISHVFAMDVPRHSRPLLVTDAAVNIHPNLAVKADIVRNAVAVGHALGIAVPKVALLSAVEMVNPALPATEDARVLTEMAQRGELGGAVIHGPLAFDNAISLEAARIKGIDTPVAGEVDVLVVPGLEAGNILYKALVYLADALAAGIVTGARVPIILTSRADNAASRKASAALACLVARAAGRSL